MSNPINKITISGFRGIPGTFELDFKKGSSVRSAIIYGRNGTGKSTITDACEWFHAREIRGLKRQGAGPTAYAHREPLTDSTYVEFTFADDNVEDTRVTLDRSAPTKEPDIDGDIDVFQERAKHPFYIRFADLKNFVFETRANKYDELANLMGFEPQVEFQESLRSVVRTLGRKVDSQEEVVASRQSDLQKQIGSAATSDEAIVSSATDLFERQGLGTPSTIADLREAKRDLATRVESDPTAGRISALSDILQQIKIINESLDDFAPATTNYINDLADFAEEQDAALNALLLNVYQAGGEYIEDAYETQEPVGECPLCGETYDGDLRQHVSDELSKLEELKQVVTDLEGRQNIAAKEVSSVKRKVQRVQAFEADIDDSKIATAFEELQDDLRELNGKIEVLIDAIDVVELENAANHARTINSARESVFSRAETVQEDANTVREIAKEEKKALAENESKLALADDHSRIVSTLEKHDALQNAIAKQEAMSATQVSFEEAVDTYIEYNSEDVERRFAEISDDVKTFFEILERDTDGLGDPEIQLTPSSTRGVRLKVHFHGEDEHPAYKYLSESQLNSFGLAVFLASVKRFNSNFPFIVLDDIINSYDAYKRTKVIDILKDELPDFQVLLLTHDSVWMGQIGAQFNDWKRMRFVDWGFGSGPKIGDPSTGVDYIESELDDDRGPQAGRDLGEYLEQQFQWLCECFEAEVKYNARNTYTLENLFTALQSRVRSKLSRSHPLYVALHDLFNARQFRNFCAHWKNPTTPYTTNEIREYLNLWKEIDAIVRCRGCGRFPSYDRSRSRFVCPCGNHELVKRNN
jgi:hypothetical protein